MSDDRFMTGVVAGLGGAIVQNIYAFLARFLGLTDTSYLDVARAVLLNADYQGVFATLVNFFGQLVVDSFWGGHLSCCH